MSARLRVHVTPRASKNEPVGWREEALSVRLTAPPVEGAANKACVDFIAELLGLKRSQVRIVSGEKSRDKVLEIEGLTDSEVRSRVDAASRA